MTKMTRFLVSTLLAVGTVMAADNAPSISPGTVAVPNTSTALVSNDFSFTRSGKLEYHGIIWGPVQQHHYVRKAVIWGSVATAAFLVTKFVIIPQINGAISRAETRFQNTENKFINQISGQVNSSIQNAANQAGQQQGQGGY